jgi:hypothetical protein
MLYTTLHECHMRQHTGEYDIRRAKSSVAQSHDPVRYDHIAELIREAEPSRQSAVLHDAWREYAATAARPYAWKTFAQYSRQQLVQSGDWSLKRGREKLAPWQDGARASPRVLVLGAYAALRVRGGALEIVHGPHALGAPAHLAITLTIHSATSSISRAGSDARCNSNCVTSRERRCTL